MTEHDALAPMYAEARNRGAIIDLSDRAKWRVTGPDRVRYLNGQVTNDIRKADERTALEACVTTAKGRLSGVINVSASPTFLRLDAEAELRGPMALRLERYMIADDVALEDTTDNECIFHSLPPASLVCPDGVEVRKTRRFVKEGFDFIAPRAEHGRLLADLSSQAVLIPASLAEVLRIEAGVPKWGAELTEETLPPEAGLDLTAIDYHKGCYIGQEVISRIKSVGHVNRALMGIMSDSALAAGMTLHPESDREKQAGEITSAAWSFGLECWAGLGYVKRGFAGTALAARSRDGATVGVKVLDLPLVP